MTRAKDFYVVLGVSPSATGDQIRLAYYELAKKHHPDNFYSYIEKNRATLTMQEINVAYEVLGNPDKRREYDRNQIDGISDVRPNEMNQGKARRSEVFQTRERFNVFSSILDQFMDHPYRTWLIAITPVSLVVFTLLEVDYNLGLHWLTASNTTSTQHVLLAILVSVLFLFPVNLFLIGGFITLVAVFIVGIPIFFVSEGLKRGLGKTFYKTDDASWKLLVDAGVRVGSLLVLTLLAVLYPTVTLVLFAAFPYNLFLLFGLGVWVGETVAVIVFIYRAKAVLATTALLLRS